LESSTRNLIEEMIAFGFAETVNRKKQTTVVEDTRLLRQPLFATQKPFPETPRWSDVDHINDKKKMGKVPKKVARKSPLSRANHRQSSGEGDHLALEDILFRTIIEEHIFL